MMKRFIAAPLAFALVAMQASYANAAGTINLSLSQQFDAQGLPLANCRLYLYQAGTVATPQNAYSDVDLTIALTNPLSCDSSGRLQQFFLADGQIKIRLTDKNGAEILAADNILVVGPSSGGGGGGSVDPTAIYQTGDIKVRYGTGTHSGWVRGNGRTIGSAASGATERANSDTQALWEYICTNDTTLRATISGGYSGSCANDYAANKTIQLPDYRGAALAGLGDMGNSATSVLTTTYCGADPTVLGQFCGAQSKTIAQANLPNVNFSVTTNTSSPISVLNGSTAAIGPPGTAIPGSATNAAGISVYPASSFGALTVTVPSLSGAAASGGSGTAFSVVPPMRLSTIYIKL